MALAVRLTGLTGLEGWLLLCLRVLVGGCVYGALCLLWWRGTKNNRVLSVLRRNQAQADK